MSGRPSSRQQVQPARRIAYDVIAAVRESDAYANLLLPVRIDRAKLNPPDAALATELTYGTLRMRGYYDRVITLAAGRDVGKIDPPILDVLRLGTHQLLATRVAAHAAVNESVALASAVGSRSATGFTNGVLRTIGRSTADEWRARVLESARSADERLAAEHSHPEWIVRAFRQSLAADGRADELADLLASDNVAPRVNMVALPGVAGSGAADSGVAGSGVGVSGVRERPDDAEADRYSPYGYTHAGGDPHAAVQASGGAFRVQDEGSQLAAIALAAAREITPGEEWLDLCAGPGGKAALLGAIARQGGARLVANELVPSRAELVASAVRPVQDSVDVWVRDGTTIGQTERERFDRVLLDAPCTGLGALRRRPEARWRKVPRDVPQLVALQSALIDSAVLALKPGGILAYVTCSPHLAETRLGVADALKRHEGELSELPTRELLNRATDAPIGTLGESDASRTGAVQLWPHAHGTDAMFIALLQKPLR